MVAPQLSGRMNWQQRSGQIVMQPGLRSIRADSGSHRDYQSSVHRLVQVEASSVSNRPVGTHPVATGGYTDWSGSVSMCSSQAGHWQTLSNSIFCI